MNETTPLNIEIKETYKGTSPPFDVAKTVRKLLLGIPRKYTNGLGTVVIRDAQSFNRKRKRQNIMAQREILL